MNSSPQLLDQALRHCRQQGCQVDHLLRFVEAIPRLLDKSQLESSIAEFHNSAGRLPYWQDYDIGALILECAADQLETGKEKDLFYQHAIYRAQWCASGSSGSGEGMARIQHVHQIQKKKNGA